MRPFRVYLTALVCATILVAGLEVAPHLAPREEPGLPRLPVLLADIRPVPQRARVLGYERTEFGAGWATVGACTVREHILITQLADTAADTAGGGCTVTTGRGRDPYTGEEIVLGPAATAVEIDHILPLSAAWDLGAHAWDPATRLAFANDPLNLLVTTREANRDKSDYLPAAWLPPDPAARCWYARRLALVAQRYALPLPREDLSAMRAACRLSGLLR
ncbi:HNH endonuclease family protein [Corynebacterium halotolerans]|uniref:GmrSD restriction endonucleases C-terminal domain-containing protein n=1 Tax=Corynebacterium halotolerans YIM 70093 = DSM 44683 TaxID=1121362 RepID=M1MWR2_9CORY|nr:HNH endonuclease family protein [Corynebacterium halotolerans]AGF72184.1 hypothetical protein A605_05890 [Corynebacterium halotolerans YIM 70093 = DSM 44683]